jgi:YidC/Oxa1 family membrane protein insertase
VQLPIFISLFNVLREPWKYVPKDSSLYEALCGGVEKCNADTANAQHFLGLNLEQSATGASGLDAIPYFLLVALVGLTGYMSVRQAQKRTPAANKQMGMVMRFLPIIFTVFSITFPSGLVLYFVVSNLWRFGQQELIFRRHGSAHHPSAKERREAARAERASAIEAESRDVSDDNGAPSGPKPVRPAKKKTPPPVPAGDADGGTDAASDDKAPVGASDKRQGGLRGLFQLPPPAEGNGGGSNKARTSTSSSPAKRSGGNPPKPPQQRRRNKKKRKR